MALEAVVNFDGVPWSLVTTPQEICFRKMSLSPSPAPSQMPTFRPSKSLEALEGEIRNLTKPTAFSGRRLRGT